MGTKTVIAAKELRLLIFCDVPTYIYNSYCHFSVKSTLHSIVPPTAFLAGQSQASLLGLLVVSAYKISLHLYGFLAEITTSDS